MKNDHPSALSPVPNSDPTEAAQTARKLILQDKIDVLIGPTTGGSTLAVGPIAGPGAASTNEVARRTDRYEPSRKRFPLRGT